MKSLLKNSLILALVASFVALYSCKTEDPIVEFDAPTMTAAIKVNGTAATSPATVEVGDVVTGDFTILAPGNFNVLRITVSVDGAAGSTIELPRTNVTGVTDFTDFDITGLALLTVAAADEDKTIDLSFEVVDDQDKTGTAPAFSMDVEVVVTVNVYTAQLLYAPLGSEDSKTFFSTNLGTTVTKNQVDAAAAPNSVDIDFGVAFGGSGNTWLASPSNYPTFTAYDLLIWNTRNTTNFKKVTLSNEAYMALDKSEEVAAVYTESTATAANRVEGVAVDDYYALQLDVTNKGGKYAIVKVLDKVDGNNDGDFIDSTDYLSIEVVVQQ